MAAPTPRSTVRREMCFLVINIPEPRFDFNQSMRRVRGLHVRRRRRHGNHLLHERIAVHSLSHEPSLPHRRTRINRSVEDGPEAGGKASGGDAMRRRRDRDVARHKSDVITGAGYFSSDRQLRVKFGPYMVPSSILLTPRQPYKQRKPSSNSRPAGQYCRPRFALWQAVDTPPEGHLPRHVAVTAISRRLRFFNYDNLRTRPGLVSC